MSHLPLAEPRYPPDARLVCERVSVNAPSIFMAATVALDNYVLGLAAQAGLRTERALAPQERPIARRSWSSLMAELARDQDDERGELTGYWVVVTSLAHQGATRMPVALSVEALAEPHRNPLAFGGYDGSERDSEVLRQETLAYWEAVDLRSSIGKASSADSRAPRVL